MMYIRTRCFAAIVEPRGLLPVQGRSIERPARGARGMRRWLGYGATVRRGSHIEILKSAQQHRPKVKTPGEEIREGYKATELHIFLCHFNHLQALFRSVVSMCNRQKSQ